VTVPIAIVSIMVSRVGNVKRVSEIHPWEPGDFTLLEIRIVGDISLCHGPLSPFYWSRLLNPQTGNRIFLKKLAERCLH